MTLARRFQFFLWSFSRFKVPLIGYLRPKIIRLDESCLIIKIPLNRRSKNHLNSMYFGALSVGADLAGGLYGFYYAKMEQTKISLAFKSFQAQFLRRPESDVYFICEQGECIKAMIQEAKKTKERMTMPIQVTAYVNYEENPEAVAQFTLELSVKILG